MRSILIVLLFTFSACKKVEKPHVKKPNPEVSRFLVSTQYKKFEKALNIGLNTDISNIKMFSLLPGGKSGAHIYTFTIKRNKYVLRYLNPDYGKARIERELVMMQAAAHKNIAPKVYYAGTQDGLVIMDFIETNPLPTSEQIVQLFADFLKTLKSITFNADTTKMIANSPYQELARNISDLPMNKLPEYVTQNYNRTLKDKNKYKSITLSSVHYDLSPANIIFQNNRIMAIDWESAGLGDPFYDLATIFSWYLHDKDSQEKLLELYLERKPTTEDWDHLEAMQQVLRCIGSSGLISHALKNKAKPLDKSEIESLPSIQDFLRLLEQGKVSLDSPKESIRFGLILAK